MDVVIYTSDPENVPTAKDIAVELIQGKEGRPIYFVASVKVIERDSGDVVDEWGE